MSYTDDVRTRSNSLVSSAGRKTGCTKISNLITVTKASKLCVQPGDRKKKISALSLQSYDFGWCSIEMGSTTLKHWRYGKVQLPF